MARVFAESAMASQPTCEAAGQTPPPAPSKSCSGHCAATALRLARNPAGNCATMSLTLCTGDSRLSAPTAVAKLKLAVTLSGWPAASVKSLPAASLNDVDAAHSPEVARGFFAAHSRCTTATMAICSWVMPWVFM